MDDKDRYIIPVASNVNMQQLDAAINSAEISVDRVRFNIYTYSKLRKISPTENNWHLIDVVNDFMATFDKDERFTLCKMFIRLHTDCVSLKKDAVLFDVVRKMASRVTSVFTRLNMIERARDYVDKNDKITFVVNEKKGRRIHDKDKLTWKEGDYLKLASLSIICKLMFPVFGEVIHRVCAMVGHTNEGKEIYAATIVADVIEKAAGDVYSRFKYYVQYFINAEMSNDDIIAMYGITPNTLVKRRTASLFVKNLVNFDLYNPKENMITYLYVSATSSAKTNYNKKNSIHYSTRKTIEDDPETNQSSIDVSTSLYMDKVEKRPLILAAVNTFITDYITRNQLREDIVYEATEWYKHNMPVPNELNSFLIGLFISNEVGSAYAVRYIDADMFIKLVVIMQLYMIRTDNAELIPMLSALTTNVDRKPELVVNKLMISRGRGPGFSFLTSTLGHLDKFINFEEVFDKLIMYIVGKNHQQNIAPGILKLCSITESSAEGYWRFNDKILHDMFIFIYRIISTGEVDIPMEVNDDQIDKHRANKLF